MVSTVNCSATVTKLICRHFLKRNLEPFGIDGVIPVVDPAGCTQVAGRSHHKLLNRTLAGWMFHPNVVAALVVGLGCEGTTYETIMAATQGKKSHQIPVERIDIQSEGGTRVTIERGIEKIESILGRLPSFRRENRSISHLKVALNCGASDAFSAITANPALGFASDCLVHRGGTVALAEIPECHGAEDLLYQKCVNEIVETKLRSIFNSWTEYTIRHQITLNNNLSEGNIAGGITTIIEKSVGAIAKAGNSALVEVIDYAEPIGGSGFTLMNTPGYDPVSVTGLVAGGCNLVAFTTGRGSVYGCSIAPTLKIATNTEMFLRMKGDMDLNAGSILTHTAIEEIGADIYRMLVHVANGQRTCSEELGLGWEEFIPWSVGEVL